MITKKELEHLAELARLEIPEKDREKLVHDLQKILNHFEELKLLNTDAAEPMSGGHFLKNAWREDEIREGRLNQHPSDEMFPEANDKYLKIPPVFDI